jgi:hypothetical protein
MYRVHRKSQVMIKMNKHNTNKISCLISITHQFHGILPDIILQLILLYLTYFNIAFLHQNLYNVVNSWNIPSRKNELFKKSLTFLENLFRIILGLLNNNTKKKQTTPLFVPIFLFLKLGATQKYQLKKKCFNALFCFFIMDEMSDDTFIHQIVFGLSLDSIKNHNYGKIELLPFTNPRCGFLSNGSIFFNDRLNVGRSIETKFRVQGLISNTQRGPSIHTVTILFTINDDHHRIGFDVSNSYTMECNIILTSKRQGTTVHISNVSEYIKLSQHTYRMVHIDFNVIRAKPQVNTTQESPQNEYCNHLAELFDELLVIIDNVTIKCTEDTKTEF